MKLGKRIRAAAGVLALGWAVMALAACSGAATSETAVYEVPPSVYYGAEQELMSEYYGDIMVEDAAEMDTGAAYSTARSAGSVATTGEALEEPQLEGDRKIIMNAWVTLESLEYDVATAAIARIIEEHGAYISNSGVYNSTIGSRSADYTIRVPAESYRGLLAALEDTGNMVSRSESSEDVTTQYIDIEARLTSLYAQEDRLMELMAEAGDLESLILVQQQLSETQYQIEYYEGIRRNYDRQITYSTVQVHLYEVVEYTEPEPEGYASQIARAFTNGWKTALAAVQSIGLAIVGGLPFLIALAIGLVVLVVLLKRSRKRSLAKLAELQAKASEAPAERKQDLTD